MIFNRLVIICAVYWNCFRLLSARTHRRQQLFWNKARAFFGVARQHIAHSTKIVRLGMRISLKDMQGFGVAFPVEQVDSGVQSYKFGVGLCLKEYFDITRITKFREEMPFHIVVGPALIQPHKQAQAAYFLGCIPTQEWYL